MTLPWWTVKKELYKQVVEDISQYPGLRHRIEDNQFVIFGAWPIYCGSGGQKWLEDFLIKIIFPNDYPDTLPKVYETGNRIKRKDANTHFYPEPDNYACLFYPTERYLYFPTNEPFSFKKFLEGPVKSFFFSQIYYIYYNKWPFGERSHNIKGLLEFYGEKLGIPCDKKSISKALSYLLKPQIKGHWCCPCGNDKLRKCHVENFRSLNNKIPKKTIKRDINFLEKTLIEKKTLLWT